MTVLFADSFYWIALADATDSAHQRALVITSGRATSRIVTTDEVLTEYLTLFATEPEQFRHQAAVSVERLLASSVVRVIPQRARGRFSRDCDSTVLAPTKVIAWSIAFRCRPCARKG